MLPKDEFSFAEKLALLFEFEGEGKSVSTVASAIGISQSTLSRLKAGKIETNIGITLALCKYFGVGLEYFDLPTEAECKNYLASLNDVEHDPLMVELSGELDKLSSQELTNVLAMLSWLEVSGSTGEEGMSLEGHI